MNQGEPPPDLTHRWILVAVVAGALGLTCYFGSVVLKPFPWSVGRILFFAIGPLTVVSVVGLYNALERFVARVPLLLGCVLTGISGVIVNLMAVVQDMQFTYFARQIRAAPTEAVEASLERMLWGVNVVQSGFDVSWDIFISLGTILLALAVRRRPLFGPVIAGLGVLAALAALSLNMIAYPTSPAEAGLIDLGPAVGAWYGLLLVRLFLARDRLSPERTERRSPDAA